MEFIRPSACWIMLNPSTARAWETDPTVNKTIQLSNIWGFGEVHILNIFPLVSTDPNFLKVHYIDNHHHKINEEMISKYITDTHECGGKVILGWGNFGLIHDQATEIYEFLRMEYKHIPLWCIKQNKNGTPVHPLYQSYKSELQLYGDLEKHGSPPSLQREDSLEGVCSLPF